MKKVVIILTFTLVGVAAWSQFSSSDEELVFKKQLTGVTGFFVFVSVHPDSLASLLPISSIRTDVELKLRIAHMPVLMADEYLKNIRNAGMISVEVDGVKSSSSPVWAITLRVECTQIAHLERDPHVLTTGRSWVAGNIAIFGESVIPQAREDIKDMIDNFVNLYLAANP